MTTYYVVDCSARIGDKTVFPTPEEAIEVAAESARQLNRAISVWEVESGRKPDPEDYPKGARAEKHYAMVMPDGTVQKSKNGDNPYVQYMENKDADETGPNGGAEQEESLEEVLKLPTRALGSVLGHLDSALASLEGATMVRPSLSFPLRRLSDRIAATLESRMSVSKMICAKFNVGDTFQRGQQTVIVTSVQAEAGTIQHTIDGVGTISDAAAFARYLLGGIAQRVGAKGKSSSDEAKKAEAHHLQSGDAAIVDQRDTALVLDAQEGVYVVLMNGIVTQVPDDVARIVKVGPDADPTAKKRARLWKTFLQALLKQNGVQDIAHLDSDMKTRMFETAKRKWPKVEKKLLAEPEQSSEEEAPKPAPKKPEPKTESQPADKPEGETAQTLLAYCMDLCGQNIETAARLEQNVRFSLGRDPTKAHALAAMEKIDTYKLPEGWFARAKVLAGLTHFSGKNLRNVDMTPPIEARASAAGAIGEAADLGQDIPAICLSVAKTLASGKTVDLHTLERMHRFFKTHQRDSVPQHIWAAWGGGPALAWTTRLGEKLWG